MTELIVDIITDSVNSTESSKFGKSKAHAWMTFSTTSATTKVNGSHGLSSVTDNGVGEPVFYLKNYISSTTSGASRTGVGKFSDGTSSPLQTGSRIKSTRFISGFFGTSTNTRGDASVGYFSLNGV